MDYKIKDISWVKVIFALMDTNSVTIQIWVNAGTLYENEDNNWISHFLEHMFFKGSKNYPSAKIISETIDWVWWVFNAFTSREETWYYVKVASDYAQIALDVLLDLIVNPLFLEEEIEKEKYVILQELKMNQDNPHKVLYDKFLEYFYWTDNPYGWQTIWTEKNILSFTKKDLLSYSKALYTKDNIIIVIAGNIQNEEKLEKMIKEKISQLNETSSLKKAKFQWIKAKEKISYFKKNVEQNHLLLAIPTIPYSNKRRYVLSVVSTILWWNTSSILFQELREKLGLCYYISTSNYFSQEDGIFLLKAGIDKKNLKKWIDKINKILDETVKWNITNKQLEKAKSYLIWKNKIWIETSDEMADYILSDYLSLGKIESLDEFLENIKNVKLEEVKDLVKEFFKNRYLFYLE